MAVLAQWPLWRCKRPHQLGLLLKGSTEVDRTIEMLQSTLDFSDLMFCQSVQSEQSYIPSTDPIRTWGPAKPYRQSDQV